MAAKILAGVGMLLAIVAIGVAIAVYTADVNTLIGPVASRVKAATGRDLTVRGGADIKLSLQPRLILSDVTLSNAPWGSAPQLMSARRIELQVALLPLLARRFELVEIELVGPVIALETDAKGIRNWEAPRAPSTAAAAGDKATGNSVAVGNIAISDGDFTYRDGATGAVTHVVIDRLFVRARNPQAPIAAQFQGKVDDVVVSLEGTLGPLESLLERRWPFPVTLKGDVAGSNVAVQTNVRGDEKSYVLDDLQATVGPTSLSGSFSIQTGGARPRFVFDLTAPALALNDVPFPVGARTAAVSTALAPSHPTATPRMFADMPLNFGALRLVDAAGSVAIGRLVLAGGARADDVRIKLALDNGRLDVPSFAAKVFGGSITGSIVVDVRTNNNPSLVVRVDGGKLDLDAILSAAGRPREVRGGKVDVAANLSMRGTSPRAWASTASGTFRAVVGHATLVNSKINLESAIDRVTTAVNPFRQTDATTELVCAVVRLPLANGVAHFDRTVAMETPQMGVSVSGTLNFRDETLDLAIKPQMRKGIPIDVTRLASLVRFSGPFASPQVKVDPVGSAAAIATIGAAISTGGLSAVGQALFAFTTEGGAGPCQIALGVEENLPAGATAATDNPAAPLLDSVGKALGRLFRR